LKKALKRAKTLKNSEKKLEFFLCVGAFTREGKMSLLKIACFMLNFQNLGTFFGGSI
jgi:hypothetical protein